MQIRGRLRVRRRLDEPRWFEQRVREIVRDERLNQYAVWGDEKRLRLHASAQVHDALFNTVSGTITVHENAFFGHGVSVLTGTHDIHKLGSARRRSFPRRGRDVVIEEGVWVASNATILGPCVIGEHAVVAAGAVVTGDVPPRTIVGGVPARPVGSL
jgi:acetyltransferase-like isoleucine patch superfamily enzyme